MKAKICYCLLLILAFANPHQSIAQVPVITSFSQNGVLVCSNLPFGGTATVEWASSLSGPWQSTWAGLTGVSVASNGTIQVSVPMFYRVLLSAPGGMAVVPGGSFTMGDNLDGESDAIPPISVNVSQFYMDTNLVSYSLWQSVYTLATNAGYRFDDAGAGKAANHPVQSVSWYDVVKWSNARSQQAGLTPVYYTDSKFTQVYTNGDQALFVNWDANGFRLPTEAEWEKAARGGLSGVRFPNYDDIFEAFNNYNGCTTCYSYDFGPNGYNESFDNGAQPYTSPVGYFGVYGENGYGINDMSGNVFEWCWDWYATTPYPAGSPYLGGTDPRGPSTGGGRVLRGGSWANQAYWARCAARNSSGPSGTYGLDGGFRCVRGH